MCIFGDGGVGKTTLVNRYILGLFYGDTTMTIGVDFHVKYLEVDGKKVALQIWDFAGEERFRFLLPTYLKGASGAIFIYDITRYSSLRNVMDWLAVVDAQFKQRERIPLLMVGGKADLAEKRMVSSSEAIEIAKSSQFSGFIECSSKTGKNVEKVSYAITQLMLEEADLISISSTVPE